MPPGRLMPVKHGITSKSAKLPLHLRKAFSSGIILILLHSTGRYIPIWMRLDNSVLSVWTTIIYDSTAVPVELNNFSSSLIDGEIYLTWTTGSETNNHGFEVERKFIPFDSEETAWHTAGFVKGKGTTTETTAYSWNETPAESGTYHYRLKQIDYNGDFSYSGTTEISFVGNLTFELYQNYPNPFNPSTIIGYMIPAESHVVIKVFDILGKEVSTLRDEITAPGYMK
jgi:hypothetical protein